MVTGVGATSTPVAIRPRKSGTFSPRDSSILSKVLILWACSGESSSSRSSNAYSLFKSLSCLALSLGASSYSFSMYPAVERSASSIPASRGSPSNSRARACLVTRVVYLSNGSTSGTNGLIAVKRRVLGVPGFWLDHEGAGVAGPDPGPSAPVWGCPLPGLTWTALWAGRGVS